MKITIFAATGGIGRQVLDQALAAGHDVTAVVRNPDALPSPVRTIVRTVKADLTTAEPAALEAAVAGADGVISALGPRSSSDIGVVARGTEAIIQAMRAVGARRLVVVSAAPISTTASPDRPNPPKHDPGEGFWMRNLLTPTIKIVLRANYADLALMEDLVRDSDLDWTIVRPPRLTDKPLTGHYRTARGVNLRRGLTVSRADVAEFMLLSLDQPETYRQAVGIAY